MVKTPEEIKKGIVESIEELSWVVEGGDAHDLQDACNKAHACMADALSLIDQLERERDAAIEALHDVRASVAGLVCMVDSKDEKIQKWTNVAEHLPQKPGKYLVYSKVGTMYTSKFDPDIHKRWPHFGKVGVTHWMPRPEEPKEGYE